MSAATTGSLSLLPNGPEAAIAFLAVASCATAAPLNQAYREEEFRFYMDDLKAKALITLPDDAPAAHAAAGPDVMRLALAGEPGSYSLQRDGADVTLSRRRYAEPDDVAMVLHTSGTTARPKIVPLSQRNLAISSGNIRESLALTPRGPLPQRHAVVPHPRPHGGVAGVAERRRFRRHVARLRRVPVLRLAGGDAADLVHGRPDDAPARAQPRRRVRRRSSSAHQLRFIRSSSASLAADRDGGAGGDVRLRR